MQIWLCYNEGLLFYPFLQLITGHLSYTCGWGANGLLKNAFNGVWAWIWSISAVVITRGPNAWSAEYLGAAAVTLSCLLISHIQVP